MSATAPKHATVAIEPLSRYSNGRAGGGWMPAFAAVTNTETRRAAYRALWIATWASPGSPRQGHHVADDGVVMTRGRVKVKSMDLTLLTSASAKAFKTRPRSSNASSIAFKPGACSAKWSLPK